MHNRIHLLNTFTVNGVGGNPTAVYFSHRRIDTEAMQLLAKELHVPVTAFVWREDADCSIRYFTAQCEIDACGHATLGAAAVASEILQAASVNFRTASNVNISTTVNRGNVNMKYPSRTLLPATAETGLLQSLDLTEDRVTGAYRYHNTLVIVVGKAEYVQQLEPDIWRLKGSSIVWEEVVVTAASNHNGCDYVLRSFCPWIGINEDPVTGSVQAALGPYWSQKLNKKKLKAYQQSKRGGELVVTANDDGVEIGGQSVFLSSTVQP